MRIQRRLPTISGFLCYCLAVIGLFVDSAWAASPSATEALALKPIQEEVDCDRPSKSEIAKCEIAARKTGGRVGWIVTSPDGTILRRFVDTNGDNRVDCWSYFKNGLEVYRDIDGDFNRKVDQCRWFNTAGCRWGIDKNEDGQIDRWKTISAEEVAAEAVAALAAADWPRMKRLIMTTDEAKSLGLGKQKQAELLDRLTSLPKTFQTLLRAPNRLDSNTRWVQFSGTVPGVVPAETDGSKGDLTVYENAAAVVQTGDNHGEVLLGTLVRVGDAWRMIDVPRPVGGDQNSAVAGFFFVPPIAARPKVGSATGPDQATQALLAQLEQVDQALQKASDTPAKAKLHAQRADLLERVAESADTPQNRAMWYHQLADMVSAAVQTGAYDEGAKRLGTLYKKLVENPEDKNLAAYVRFRQIMADYGLSFQAPKPDYEKIQKTLIENLEKYIGQYPDAPETPEAMFQLAMTLEFLGEEKEARRWHERIVHDAPESPIAQKARGARIRLDSVGKQIAISGNSPSGSRVDLSDYRGKAVLVQYWATWCEPAKADMAGLKELTSKYGGQFRVVGVSLDNQLADLKAYLKENPLPWPQIFEQGGLDSRPANELGILTVPTMILIDKDGKVVNRNVSLAELDKELKTILR
ncbi:MAG: redoxin domain-containing protein [Pirellulales bacterium]|nr:redoxin domain-containing protein [Pirellulales bacterium]